VSAKAFSEGLSRISHMNRAHTMKGRQDDNIEWTHEGGQAEERADANPSGFVGPDCVLQVVSRDQVLFPCKFVGKAHGKMAGVFSIGARWRS
jgi:hypothetical protein